jgi:type IV pilus assembly protein PilO
MENFNEMPGLKQWGALIIGAALITVALFFVVFKGQQDTNEKAQKDLTTKLQENAELERYRPKLAEIERQVASLKQQLDIERRIVPDDKEVDGFIKMLDAEARKAGIEIRSFTANPVSSRDFYNEVPFQLELDGPYYSVLGFFDQVSKLERIVDISGLQIATTKKASDAKVKHTYNYAANESVVASCVATTFYSHDMVPTKSATPVKGRKAI